MTFFQILWKSRYYILVTFQSDLKKFYSLLRFLTQKVELWIFLLVILLMKRHHKIFFLSNFQCRKWIFVELVNRAKICHKNQSVTNFIGAGKNLLFRKCISIFEKKCCQVTTKFFCCCENRFCLSNIFHSWAPLCAMS